jgi:hypothetical protein
MGNGRFWLIFWLVITGVVAVWAVLTVIFWRNSVTNISVMSAVALLLAPAGGLQAALTMRKTDPEDPL